MAYARIASRLKLLGLLLICTSVIVFLILSACGVTSVRVHTPFGQRLATRWQIVSSPAQATPAATPLAADNFLTAAPALASPPQYAASPTGGLQVLPPGNAGGQYNPVGQYPVEQYPADPYSNAQNATGQYAAGQYNATGQYPAAQYTSPGQYPGGQTAAIGGGPAYVAPAAPTSLFNATDFGQVSTGATASPIAVESAAAAAEAGLRIPLWCINAVFLAIGFVLWGLPQPRPFLFSAGRRN